MSQTAIVPFYLIFFTIDTLNPNFDSYDRVELELWGVLPLLGLTQIKPCICLWIYWGAGCAGARAAPRRPGGPPLHNHLSLPRSTLNVQCH